MRVRENACDQFIAAVVAAEVDRADCTAARCLSAERWAKTVSILKSFRRAMCVWVIESVRLSTGVR